MVKHAPIVVTQEIKATLKDTWRALTDLYELRNWYFYLDEFKPDIGYSFHFMGGDETTQYVHLCEITKVVEHKLLEHTWKYKDYVGESLVKFEIAASRGHTIVTVTHSGVESFAVNGKNFSRESFQKGWQQIIGTQLREYLEHK